MSDVPQILGLEKEATLEEVGLAGIPRRPKQREQ